MSALRKFTVAILGGLLLAVGMALAGDSASVDWSVVGGGGGRAEAGGYAMETVGQPVVGSASANSFQICSGFWCGAAVKYNLYLPVVTKE